MDYSQFIGDFVVIEGYYYSEQWKRYKTFTIFVEDIKENVIIFSRPILDNIMGMISSKPYEGKYEIDNIVKNIRLATIEEIKSYEELNAKWGKPWFDDQS